MRSVGIRGRSLLLRISGIVVAGLVIAFSVIWVHNADDGGSDLSGLLIPEDELSTPLRFYREKRLTPDGMVGVEEMSDLARMEFSPAECKEKSSAWVRHTAGSEIYGAQFTGVMDPGDIIVAVGVLSGVGEESLSLLKGAYVGQCSDIAVVRDRGAPNARYRMSRNIPVATPGWMEEYPARVLFQYFESDWMARPARIDDPGWVKLDARVEVDGLSVQLIAGIQEGGSSAERLFPSSAADELLDLLKAQVDRVQRLR